MDVLPAPVSPYNTTFSGRLLDIYIIFYIQSSMFVFDLILNIQLFYNLTYNICVPLNIVYCLILIFSI